MKKTILIITLIASAWCANAAPELTNTEATNIDQAAERQAWREALELWTDDAVTFGSGTISGDLTVDTLDLFVDASANQIGIGTITPATLSNRGILIYDAGSAGFALQNSANKWDHLVQGGTGKYGLYSSTLSGYAFLVEPTGNFQIQSSKSLTFSANSGTWDGSIFSGDQSFQSAVSVTGDLTVDTDTLFVDASENTVSIAGNLAASIIQDTKTNLDAANLTHAAGVLIQEESTFTRAVTTGTTYHKIPEGMTLANSGLYTGDSGTGFQSGFFGSAGADTITFGGVAYYYDAGLGFWDAGSSFASKNDVVIPADTQLVISRIGTNFNWTVPTGIKRTKIADGVTPYTKLPYSADQILSDFDIEQDLLNNYVDKSSNQTIGGDKDFSGQVELTGQAASSDDSAMTRGLSDARYGGPIYDCDSTVAHKETTATTPVYSTALPAGKYWMDVNIHFKHTEASSQTVTIEGNFSGGSAVFDNRTIIKHSHQSTTSSEVYEQGTSATITDSLSIGNASPNFGRSMVNLRGYIEVTTATTVRFYGYIPSGAPTNDLSLSSFGIIRKISD